MRGYAEALWGQWRPSSSEEELEIEGHLIIEAMGVEVGCVATEYRRDHLWIDKLYIHPSFQRRGFGAHVLRHVERQAGAANLPVKVSVITTNPALAFDQREGFAVCDETPERRYMAKSPPFADDTGP